jgi:hypothetical protein
MQRSKALLPLAFAALYASAVFAQSSSYTQAQAAPIERPTPRNYYSPEGQPGRIATPVSSQPAPGILLRTERNSAVKIISAYANRIELRVERGRANVNVHDPAHNALVLVDLPGGQTQLLKNGLYTFNAGNNTVCVLKGEAKAFAGQSDKSIKVKEYHQVAFTGTNIRSIDVGPFQARADLLPGSYANNPGAAYGDGFRGGPIAGDYGYGYPYYAYGYPYGFYGYPYGWGYPYGYGFGFGYYGGFGGFRGFRGGRRF